MKISLCNKILAYILLVLACLTLLTKKDEQTSVRSPQPTPLLQTIADRGIPMCGATTARYQLKDAEDGIFKELSAEDRTRFAAVLITSEEDAVVDGTPKAIVYIGRNRLNERVTPRLPMFLIFLSAGGEGTCLLGSITGHLPIYEELAQKYEHR
jgi:hypothetical protein